MTFNLSEKISNWEDQIKRKRHTLETEDVKEFIKLVKDGPEEDELLTIEALGIWVDKLAGDDLK